MDRKRDDVDDGEFPFPFDWECIGEKADTRPSDRRPTLAAKIFILLVLFLFLVFCQAF